MASRTRRNRKPESNVEIVAESSDENSPTSTHSSPCRPNNGPTSPNNKFLDARCISSEAPSWVAMFRIQLTDDIDKKLDEKIHLLEGNLDQRFSDLELKIGDVKQKYEHALQRIKDNETLVGETRNEVSKMRDDLAGMTKAVKSLANEMEDLRNRGMRKTLIFHGFPESKKSFESWDDCKNMIEKYLSICGLKNCNIDRAHRVERKQSNTLSPRPIYAEFTSWQNANRVLSNANAIVQKKYHASGGSNHTIKVEQLFSKATMEKRKNLLKIRRYFLDTNEGWKIKLNYPAMLHINSGSGFRRYEFDVQDLNNAQDYLDSKN